MVVNTIPCTPVIKSDANGKVIFCRQPISFIGGVDPETGIILDPLNDRHGESVADSILVFPFGKGSSGAGLVLLELVRAGKSPRALIMLRVDTVLLTGPLVSREFYKKEIAVVTVDEEGMDLLSRAEDVDIDCGTGTIAVKA